jgi:hypothetical protein
MDENYKVYGGSFPNTLLKEYKPFDVYTATVSLEGDWELPHDFVEIEFRKLDGIAKAAAIGFYSGRDTPVQGIFDMVEPPRIDKGVSWLSDFAIASNRLDAGDKQHPDGTKVLTGHIDVDFIGWVPRDFS